MLFPEACVKLEQYRAFRDALPNVPILANITEFGQTPLYTVDELKSAGVSMVLYPLSAFRAMSQAAMKVYQAIITEGSQKSVVPLMQTRAELYDVLHYHEYEKRLDNMFGKDNKEEKQ
jgi:methylisocitrate lyase